MKLAITYENGQVFQHFGQTECFKIYTVENNRITDAVIVGTNGSGHGALTGFLTEYAVDTLICGGIGSGAKQMLDAVGIEYYSGVSGNTDRAAEALLFGKLSYNAQATCDHHEGHASGGCAEHSCGEHHHGV